jgi:hypothetical protein
MQRQLQLNHNLLNQAFQPLRRKFQLRLNLSQSKVASKHLLLLLLHLRQ